MNFTPNLVAGIVLTLVGLALMLDRLGAVAASTIFQFWPVAIILLGASVVVQALRGDNGADAARRDRSLRGPGFVLICIVVWLIASNAGQRRSEIVTDSRERVSMLSVMGRDSRASRATSFRGAEVTMVMGRSELDLRGATIAPGTDAVIDVSGLMGRIEVLVPMHWTVEIDAAPIMGTVRDVRGLTPEELGRIDRRRRRPDDSDVAPPAVPAPVPAPVQGQVPGGEIAGAAPRIVIRGFVMMGALVVRS